jgi:hypothetical protein
MWTFFWQERRIGQAIGRAAILKRVTRKLAGFGRAGLKPPDAVPVNSEPI